jgi:glutathione S-transferase
MHSGFMALRSNLSMHIKLDFPLDYANADDALLADIARIEEIWASCLTKSSGPYLFGSSFTAADAMYAPVVMRFKTYHTPVSELSKTYM